MSATSTVVRHGKTRWNAEGKRQGQLNSPLTETGLRYRSSAFSPPKKIYIREPALTQSFFDSLDVFPGGVGDTHYDEEAVKGKPRESRDPHAKADHDGRSSRTFARARTVHRFRPRFGEALFRDAYDFHKRKHCLSGFEDQLERLFVQAEHPAIDV